MYNQMNIRTPNGLLVIKFHGFLSLNLFLVLCWRICFHIFEIVTVLQGGHTIPYYRLLFFFWLYIKLVLNSLSFWGKSEYKSGFSRENFLSLALSLFQRFGPHRLYCVRANFLLAFFLSLILSLVLRFLFR